VGHHPPQGVIDLGAGEDCGGVLQSALLRCGSGLRRGHSRDEISTSPSSPTGTRLGLRRVSLPARRHHLAVRWYLRFGLSYRDVEELLAERGIEVDHVTVYRWVQRFSPEFAEAAGARRHVLWERWNVEETYVRVGGTRRYLFRAIDQFGRVIDLFLSPRRNREAARRFFERAIGGPASHPWRSPPTGTASTPVSWTSWCRQPSMTRRSTPTTRWRPTTGASRPDFDPCVG
jgi:hypothetical protein